jgi:hypothetical protein
MLHMPFLVQAPKSLGRGLDQAWTLPHFSGGYLRRHSFLFDITLTFTSAPSVRISIQLTFFQVIPSGFDTYFSPLYSHIHPVDLFFAVAGRSSHSKWLLTLGESTLGESCTHKDDYDKFYRDPEAFVVWISSSNAYFPKTTPLDLPGFGLFSTSHHGTAWRRVLKQVIPHS